MSPIHGHLIEIRFDQERGCGWRQAGGKYLVGGELCRPCGKLPFPLDRCPCCDRGIKPSRGWRWIGARQLLGRAPCRSDTCDGRRCLLWDPPERAGLLWIGGRFYAMPEAFTREAAALGISRRIVQIPKEFKVRETLVLFAHREVSFTWGEEPRPGIFAAFIPRAIEYVVRGDESPAELERLIKQGCSLVRVERITETLETETDEGAHNQSGWPGGLNLRPENLPGGNHCPDRERGGSSRPVRQVPAPPAGGTVDPGAGGGAEAGGPPVYLHLFERSGMDPGV